MAFANPSASRPQGPRPPRPAGGGARRRRNPLVITALVGTRDLGQEVYVALTKADTGRGVVAGLCVAFIAITADRLIQAGVARLKARGAVA